MKRIQPKFTAAALVLAATTSLYAAESPAASTNATASKTPPPATKGYVHFEGTDLVIGSLPPIAFHGFASQGFLASDKYNYLGDSSRGSFEFSEFGLNASVSPFERTRISAQAFSFDVGNVGRYDVALDYAQIDYTFNDKIGIRAGRVRRPNGIYNHIQDVDLARTWVLLPQGLYDARWRDFSASLDGGSIYGSFGLGKAGSLSYEAYGGMMNLSENGGIAKLLQDSLAGSPVVKYRRVNGFPIAGAQLWWTTPIDGLRAGFSVSKAYAFSYDYNVTPPFGPGPIHSVIDAPSMQYSLEYLWKSWTFQAEYKRDTYESHDEIGGASVNKSTTHTDKWFASAAYRFNKWLEVGSYYSEYYANENNRDGAGTATPSDAYQKDWALSFRFDPKPWWIIKVEGHAINGTGLLDYNAANPVRKGGEWFMLAVKTTFSF